MAYNVVFKRISSFWLQPSGSGHLKKAFILIREGVDKFLNETVLVCERERAVITPSEGPPLNLLTDSCSLFSISGSACSISKEEEEGV